MSQIERLLLTLWQHFPLFLQSITAHFSQETDYGFRKSIPYKGAQCILHHFIGKIKTLFGIR